MVWGKVDLRRGEFWLISWRLSRKRGFEPQGGFVFNLIFGFSRARPKKCAISMVSKNSFYGNIYLGVLYDPIIFAGALGAAQSRDFVSKMHLKTHTKPHCVQATRTPFLESN
jgi:hypothetical protein